MHEKRRIGDPKDLGTVHPFGSQEMTTEKNGGNLPMLAIPEEKRRKSNITPTSFFYSFAPDPG